MNEKLPWLDWIGMNAAKKKPEPSVFLRLLITLTALVSVIAVLREEAWPAWSWWNILLILIGSWISWARKDKNNWPIRALLAVIMVWIGISGISEIWSTPYDPRVPLANLMIHLLVIHCFDMPTRKDLNYTLLVSLILMALAAVFSNDLFFGGALAIYCILIIFSLILAASRENEDLSAGTFPPSFKASIPLFFRLSLGLGGITLLGCFFLFLSVPRLQSFTLRVFPVSLRLPSIHFFHGNVMNPGYPTNMNRGPNGNSPLSRRLSGIFNPDIYFGFNEYLDLSFRGKLSDKILMKVKSQAPGYWRGLVFDRYDGQGWNISDNKPDSLNVVDSYVELSYFMSYPKFHPVVQTFTSMERLPNLVFSLYQPVSVYFPSSTLYRDMDDTLRIPFFLEPGTVYTVISHVPDLESLLPFIRASAPVYPKSMTANYLQLPAELPERVKALALEITQDKATPYEKVTAILNWLHQFPYSLDIPPPPEGTDAVDHFLFTLKKGYCEQFASAFAVLARASGIPTRVVTGYAAGSYNPFTMNYEVRAKDAHAWDEVYFTGVGWIPFDASPPYAAIPVTPWRRAASNLTNVLNYITGILQRRLPNAASLIVPHIRLILVLFLTLMILLPTFFLILSLEGFIKGLWPLSRSGKKFDHGAHNKIAKIYFKLEKSLKKQGYHRKLGETPLEFLASLPAFIQSDAAHELALLYLRSRFSNEAISPSMISRAESLLRMSFPDPGP